jgi:hypothetical protein
MGAVLKSNTQAMSLVRQRLSSGKKYPDLNGLLCAVTAMACHAHLNGDLSEWNKHMAAILYLIDMRGGPESLKHLPELRKVIQWVELIGCYVLDQPPTLAFDIYAPMQMHFSVESCRSADAFSSILPPTSKLVPITGYLSMLNEFRTYNTETCAEHWQYDYLLHDSVNGIIQALLCHPRMTRLDEQSDFREAACRTGILLYLAQFRRQCGDAPVTTFAHVEQLQHLLLRPTATQLLDHLSFEMWLTVLGALEASAPLHNAFFEDRLAHLLVHRSFSATEELEAELHSIVWLDSLFRPALRSMVRRCNGSYS